MQHHVPPQRKATFGQIEASTAYVGSSAGAASHGSLWPAGRALRGDSDSDASSTSPWDLAFKTKSTLTQALTNQPPALPQHKWLRATSRLSPGAGKQQSQPVCLELKG